MLPFSFVDDPLNRAQAASDAICSKTLKKYMHKLCGKVEKIIAEKLPDKFILLVDGWSRGKTHFFGVFATFP